MASHRCYKPQSSGHVVRKPVAAAQCLLSHEAHHRMPAIRGCAVRHPMPAETPRSPTPAQYASQGGCRRTALRRQVACRSDSASELQSILGEMGRQLQAMQGLDAAGSQHTSDLPGSTLAVQDVWHQPPGCEAPLLRDVSMTLPANSLGLVYGRSGSGKTTLLQLLAGLREPTHGAVKLMHPNGMEEELDSLKRQAACGLVFQFPERHFLGSTMYTELLLDAPSPATMQGYAERLQCEAAMQRALAAVKASHFPLSTDPSTLSGGYQRRLALAVQLMRKPAVLLLDEPLAGLDWQARTDLVNLLRELKTECSLLIISHDLRELAPVVDVAWEMLPGGKLQERKGPLPVPSLGMDIL